MTDFPLLLSLDTDHFGKVLSKFDPKSYFRLQQTCRAVGERIQSTRNICLHLKGHYLYHENRNGQVQFHSESHHKINVSCLRGVRVESLSSPERLEKYETFCHVLKHYRITCSHLSMNRTSYTLDQCAEILKLTKPEKVILDSRNSDRFEALFQQKTVQSVEVVLDKDNAEGVIPQLLTAFPDVKIRVAITLEDFHLLNSTLQLLRSKSFSNLRSFQLELWGNWTKSKEELELEFRSLEWVTELEQDERNQYGAPVYLPLQRPETYSCKITVLESGMTGAYIDYKTLDAESSDYSNCEH